MTSNPFPKWFQGICCLVSLCALLIPSIGLAYGTTVNPLVMIAVVPLCSRVVGQVLGIEQKPLVIIVPFGRKDWMDKAA